MPRYQTEAVSDHVLQWLAFLGEMVFHAAGFSNMDDTTTIAANGTQGHFNQTYWTEMLAAANHQSPGGSEALS